MKLDLPYLKHILDAIGDIESSVTNMSKEDFDHNKDAQDANVRGLEVIGEAAKCISQDLKELHPEIEWKKIMGTRDVLIHRYFSVNMNLVWEIIQEEIPKLKAQIQLVVSHLEERGDSYD